MAALLLSGSDSGRRADGYAILPPNPFRKEKLVAAVGDIVRFESVGMRYRLGAEVLHDVSFSLAAGSFHFLTGPSGAGKSSLMRLMYLAHRPSRGSISMFGRDVSTVPRPELAALRRRIGVVFQDFRLLDHLSALDNVALPLRIAGAKEGQIRDHVAELLRWVGLEEQIDAKPTTLSGGEQQRVAIARAVIARPQILLADEPTGNVDGEIAIRLMYLLEELNKIGTTVVVATHNEALLERFPHPRIRIENGILAGPDGANAAPETAET
jgi:cell division transport system ATP-binding protein